MVAKSDHNWRPARPSQRAPAGPAGTITGQSDDAERAYALGIEQRMEDDWRLSEPVEAISAWRGDR
jgi:hypothetical protein